MKYQVCSRCVMDTTDPKITFDQNGVCSHCQAFDEVKKKWKPNLQIQKNGLEKFFTEVRETQSHKRYDSIIGLSGGVDSSYVAYLAKKHNLRPLCIHLDNGWNSELATDNIHRIVEKCGFDLHTHVIDWQEFRDLQRAFIKANVIDLEVLTDHAIFGVIIQLARKYKIKYILSGANYSTEFIMPKSWVHRKQDLVNIKDISRKFGCGKIKTFPQVSTLKHVIFMYLLGHHVYKPLNLFHYRKEEAKEILKSELGWRDYGGKHYESIFTKFYQAYILPTKFNVDKRKAHLSTLINTEQMTREEALEELKKPLYDPKQLEEDRDFVLKKLGFTRDWFEEYLKSPQVSHYEFKSDQGLYDFMASVKSFLDAK